VFDLHAPDVRLHELAGPPVARLQRAVRRVVSLDRLQFRLDRVDLYPVMLQGIELIGPDAEAQDPDAEVPLDVVQRPAAVLRRQPVVGASVVVPQLHPPHERHAVRHLPPHGGQSPLAWGHGVGSFSCGQKAWASAVPMRES